MYLQPLMKKFVYLLFTLFLAVSFTSCGAGCSAKSAKSKTNKEIASYTLKNKKEIMEQQILHKKRKTIIVKP